jgi:hypothetical protein
VSLAGLRPYSQLTELLFSILGLPGLRIFRRLDLPGDSYMAEYIRDG